MAGEVVRRSVARRVMAAVVCFGTIAALVSAASAAAPPDTTVGSPSQFEVIASPATLTGVATDDLGVSDVGVAIRDIDSGLWLQDDAVTFAAGFNRLSATLDQPGQTSTGWSLVLNLPDGNYGASAAAVDGEGQQDPSPVWRRFIVSSTPLVPPDGVVTSPAHNDTVAPPVSLVGSATDDSGVADVMVAVRDVNQGLWLQADETTFGPAFHRFSTVLDAPLATSTGWTRQFALPDGSYGFSITAVDVDGLEDDTKPWLRVDVDQTLALTPPDVTIADPLGDHLVLGAAGNPVEASGTATDDVDVVSVGVAVNDLASGQWLQTDGTLGAARVELPATITPAAAGTVDWSLFWTPPADGSYRLEVTAVDDEATPSPVESVITHQGFRTFSGTGDAASASWIVHQVASADDGRLLITLDQDDPNAELRLLLRQGTSTVLYATKAGVTPKVLSKTVAAGSSYTVAVSTASGASDYDLTVQLVDSAPDPDETFGGTVTAGGMSDHALGVFGPGLVVAQLDWAQPGADLDLILIDESGSYLNVSDTGDQPETVAFVVPSAGAYTLRARSSGGGADYTIVAQTPAFNDLVPDPPTIAAPVADEVLTSPSLSASGTAVDDVAVAEVRVAVQDTASGDWLQADGSLAATRHEHAAILSDPLATSSDWTIQLGLPADGAYLLEAVTVDVSDQSSAAGSVAFSVTNDGLPGTIPNSTWGANGPVYDLEVVGSTVYLGGLFDQVGPALGSAVALDAATGTVLTSSAAAFDGPVHVVVPDGQGGFYVGGNFTYVGSAFRRGGARIDAAGNLTNWAPRTNGPVYDLVPDPANGRVIVVGEFSTIRGTSVGRVASVDAESGSLLSDPWPTPNDDVFAAALSADGSTLYLGGRFNAASGQARAHLAAADTASGALLPWDPDADGFVTDIAIDGPDVVVAGEFSTVGSVASPYLARVVAGAADSAFLPLADGPVAGVVVDGGRYVVGGEFSTIGGAARSGLAAIDRVTAAADAWDPAPNGAVSSVAMTPAGEVAVGGSFTAVGGEQKRYAALVDSTTGDALASGFDPGGPVLAIGVSSSTVLVAGDFYVYGGVHRQNLAAVDLLSGAAISGFAADTDDAVRRVVIDSTNNRLLVGGSFSTVGGVAKAHFAAVDPVDGSIDANPVPAFDDTVYAIAVHGTDVYVGGDFTESDGVVRGRLIRFDATTGVVDGSFTPRPDGQVRDIAPMTNGVMFAGVFGVVDTVNRARVAAVDFTGALLPFDVGSVYTSHSPAFSVDLSADESMVYVATGGWKSHGGNRVRAFDATSGALLWDHAGDGDAQAVFVNQGRVFVGSHWDLVTDTGNACRRLCVFDAVTGDQDLSWTAKANSQLGVWVIDAAANGLVIGGEFWQVGNVVQPSVAFLPY